METDSRTDMSDQFCGESLEKQLKRHDNRQLCVHQWYIATRHKLLVAVHTFFCQLTNTFSHFSQGLDERIWHNAIWYSDPTSL